MSKDSRAGFGLPLRQGHRHHQYVVMGGTVRRVLGKNTQKRTHTKKQFVVLQASFETLLQ